LDERAVASASRFPRISSRAYTAFLNSPGAVRPGTNEEPLMLARLSIRDIVLIDRLDIDFAGGLSVLTGETGAGKSILLDAFALALGSRGDAALVRHGVEQGQVTAVFEPPPAHPVRELLATNGIAAEDELILRRIQLADGRTRAFVNDAPVSAQTLRMLGAALVEIHGQHDERALVDAKFHRRLLDAFGGLDDDAAKVEQLWEERCAREKELVNQREEVERAQREADWLRHAVEELARLDPQASEESVLAQKRAFMMQAEKVVADLRDAHEAVAGAHSPLPLLAAAARRLERRCAQAPVLIEPVVKAFDAALRALDEVPPRCVPAIATRSSLSASRSACSACAQPHASTTCRWMISMRWALVMPPTCVA
jgi:DNA repair protein RecN (Recombination protein N)